MQMTLDNKENINAKPFLKWAGGKGQLLGEFNKRLPSKILNNRTIENYIEPFIGGGAMFFFLRNNYNIQSSHIFDINKELILGYKVIQNDVTELTNQLCKLEKEYLLKSDDKRKEFYYEIRDRYNNQMHDIDFLNYNPEWIKRAVYLIFLNKTGFNGLFRLNKSGGYNVPVGRYKNPKICDEKNLFEVNRALKHTTISCDDFLNSLEYVTSESFVYLDPPYRPISKTSSFTSYAKDGFNDNDQVRLAQMFRKMDKKGAFLMLSNSDPKNNDPEDDFFDELYEGYNIERVPAKRFINCDASKRGNINEIIVRNY